VIVVVIEIPFPSIEDIVSSLEETFPQIEKIELVKKGQAIGIKISASTLTANTIAQQVGKSFYNIPLEIVEE
jgi:hypothetical protein